MAMRGRGTGRGNPSRPPRLITGRVYEEFKPMSEWRQEDDYDTLLLYLPGFQKEYIKVTTEDLNIVRVRGERLIADNKWSRFQEDYRVPENCEMRGIRAKFDGGILTITMPRKITSAPPPPQPATTQLPPKLKEQPKEKKPDKPPTPLDATTLPPPPSTTQLPPKIKEPKPDKPQTTPLDTTTLPPPPSTTQLPPKIKEQPQTTPLDAYTLPPPRSTTARATNTQLVPKTKEQPFIRAKQEPTLKEEPKEKKPEKPQSTPLKNYTLPPQQKPTSSSTPTKQEPLKPAPGAKEIVPIPKHNLKQEKHYDAKGEKTDLDKGKGKEGETKRDLKGFWSSEPKKVVASWMANEDRKSLVNVGVSVMVIVALGVHVSYTIGLISKGK